MTEHVISVVHLILGFTFVFEVSLRFLVSMLRCFVPLFLWSPPGAAIPVHTGAVLLLLPAGGVGRGGIKIASYCSARGMDSYGLKLYSGTKFSH